MRNSTWCFTTTNRGQECLFDLKFDAIPFLSRAKLIQLDMTDDTKRAFAARARDIAMESGLDSASEDEYLDLARECKGNLRAMLQAVEMGALRKHAGTSLSMAELIRMLHGK